MTRTLQSCETAMLNEGELPRSFGAWPITTRECFALFVVMRLIHVSVCLPYLSVML